VLHGIGIDIHEVGRFQSHRCLEDVLQQIFSSLEIERGSRHARPHDYWTLLFACKEAILKACAIGLYFGSYWHDITIERNDEVTLNGMITQHLKGAPKAMISHTCAKKIAVSCAIITT
jgi:phosphopantetheine--protein transferase-like protein